MKLFWVSTAILLAGIGLGTPGVVAQEFPTTPEEPGFWQPIARFDPALPVRVRLVNRTGSPLLYTLTTEEAEPRRLPPGGRVVLSNILPDSFVLVYSEDATEQEGLAVKYRVTVEDNTITNVITRSAIAQGDRILHLHKNGGIYVY